VPPEEIEQEYVEDDENKDDKVKIKG